MRIEKSGVEPDLISIAKEKGQISSLEGHVESASLGYDRWWPAGMSPLYWLVATHTLLLFLFSYIG